MHSPKGCPLKQILNRKVLKIIQFVGRKERQGTLINSAAPFNFRKKLVPDAGVEPATFGLQNRCSTS
jgi:hypothetical protein